jgi:membrane-anchored mycosin MYCP
VWSEGVAGPQIVLSAPGVDIETTQNHQPDGHLGGYQHVSGGTSASAPIVAGAAALVRARFPQLHAADVINRLIRTADDAGATGRDPQYGFGIVNLVKALTADVPPVSANPLLAGAQSASPSAAAPAERHNSPPALLLIIVLAGVGGVLILVVALVAVLVRRR